MRKGFKDYIYPSKSVKARMRGIPESLRQIGMSQVRLANKIGSTEGGISNMIRLLYYPRLWQYVKMSKLLGWDLSHDVNYAYYARWYKSSEILYRLKRISISDVPLSVQILAASAKIGYEMRIIKETIEGRPHSSLRCFGALMHYIQDCEGKQGLYASTRMKCLDFEE